MRNSYERNDKGRGDHVRNFGLQRPKLEPESIPDNYVDLADERMREYVRLVSTSKIRNLYSLVMDIYNQEVRRMEDDLLPESAAKLSHLRVRVAYEAGRDSKVGSFVEEAHLLPYIKGVKNRLDLIRLAQYMEALVAYHRYHGGRES